MSDEDLMLEFQRGSREAFQELFSRYYTPLHGFFRRRIGDEGRAQDLTQDTFLAVLRAIGRYQATALVRTYLYGIAVKLVQAERRKSGYLPLDQGGGPSSSGNDHALWVRQALSRLDEQEREILMLREYEQLSYDEIAHVLKIPMNTVRSRLFRARLALKNHLQPTEVS